ncbi:hypothetical protein [Sulfurimonas sp. NWX367]|uniref:hypothetical protein n=1 Tax=Sulfurimonas sp. NWX367 TaxID=2925413 RepID=UPI003204F6D7
MISKTALIQIIVGIVGFFSTIGMFYLGKIYNWQNSMDIIASVLLAIGTILIELSISFTNLKDSIEKLYPVLELSAEEQKNIHSAILMTNQLKIQENNPYAQIALISYGEAVNTLKQAVEGNNFYINNIFQANYLALKSMQPGQTFKGLSALISEDYWNHDPEMERYKELNFSQAQRGIKIIRIFLFNNEHELSQMKKIMTEQQNNKIQVFYCFKKDIENINHYSDFTSIKDLNMAIIVEQEEKLQTVTITQNEISIGILEKQFDRILIKSKKFDAG